MESDDKNQTEDQRYQRNFCGSISSNPFGKPAWSSLRRSTEENTKPKQQVHFQCPSPVNTPVSDSVGESIEETDIDDLGDLLQRFDMFFREKVDAELHSMNEFMHGLLSEQQLHLQQILKSRIHIKSCVCVHEETSSSNQRKGLQDHKVPEFSEDSPMQMDHESSEMYKRCATHEILLELMSLSCELSALLSQSKFM